MNTIDKTISESEYFNLIKQGKAILSDGYYIENDRLMFVEAISENCKWDKENKVWIDLTTDLEKVQAQIQEYSELDTPSTLKEMGTELANECMNMLIELRSMAYTLGNPATIEDKDLLVLPKPSKELEAFKNKFKKFF